MVRLGIATTSSDDGAFAALFALYAQAVEATRLREDVILDFEHCIFLHQNAVAFLGGLIRTVQRAGCKVYIDEASLNRRVRANLGRNGFLHTLGLSHEPTPKGNSIPFREDHDARNVMEYLRSDWLGRGWVNVSTAVQDAIAAAVWELYGNAFEHGSSEVGVFSCGQRYPQREEIALTIVDFGPGIPGTVRSVSSLADYEDDDAIEWAVLPGTTSKPGNRGMGLNLLLEFLRLNKGRVDILSHSGIVKIAGGRLLKRRSNHHFRGTVLNVMLKQDEKRYVFANEVDEPLF
ncbi:MAG TPA: hypothetical protein VIJ12_03010 [Candidatus Baltobacteraceae bacterium]